MKFFLIIAAILGLAPLASAEDWPMWRGDAQRSGSTATDLPADLHLQWTRELPAPRPAWENEDRLHFDTSYHPVVTGKTLVIASPNDGSVMAFDTDTGSETWRFFTNGPVRLAPVAAGGKVFAGSDDGYLYCLDAKSGEEIWKVRAAPKDRPEYRHLGNGRLVSFWPVRGGPVLSEDGKTLYFGSGIWPSLGVFVFAVNVETGEIQWSNSNAHYLPDTRIDHNYLHESGISPQGHFLIAGDRLIVTNGRSMPARLDRDTGELLHFVQGYRNGDSRVSVFGDIALVGERGVMDLNTGLEIGAAPFVEAGDSAPKAWDGKKKEQFEGPYYQYKFLKGCDHRSVLHQGIAYGAENGVVYAYDMKAAKVTRYEKVEGETTVKPAQWDAPLLWEYQGRVGEKNAQVTPNAILKAGGRLYTHFEKTLIALELPTEPSNAPTLAWSKELPEIPTELIAADGKLFAVAESGTIFCFSETKREALNYALPANSEEISPAPGGSEVAKLLETSGATEGYALVLGIEDGSLVEGLLRHSNLRVIAIDSDWALHDDLRRRFVVDGPWSGRFQAVSDDPATVRIAPYLANLITSEKVGVEIDDRIHEMLRPYGGVACFATADGFATKRREGPLPDSADWTHETGNAARTYFSPDKLVKAPLAILWYGDGVDHGFHKRKDYGHGVKPQVAGGRIFALQVESNTLHAVDCYTGRLLWTAKVDDSARYVSWPDAIYVAQGRTVDVLDASTGKVTATWPLTIDLPEDAPISATDVRVTDETVLIGLRFNNEQKIENGRWESELLVALDRATGKQLWSRQAAQRYSTAAVAMAKGTVFCIDSHSPIEIQSMRRRGDSVATLTSTVLALDHRTGEERWRFVLDNPPAEMSTIHFLGLRSSDDWLACAVGQNLLIAGKDSRTVGLNLDTGKAVWQRESKGQQPLIITGDTFINQTGHTYATNTGEVIDNRQLFTRGGCNYAVGSENLLFLRDNCAAYVDIDSGEQFNLRNLRSGCSASLVAADGLLNAPCFSVGCICNYPIQTSFSMWHLPEAGEWNKAVAEIAEGN
ncbi:MAG: PQQ-binding-like beta-propeller repeat protein [Verrucomicrobiae bacterium]|nr:PQQ-binding-like beta-propeller repeat protein [Verrucomicrobiae bacterium]